MQVFSSIFLKKCQALFFPNIGHRISIAIPISPTISAFMFIVPIDFAIALTFSVVSMAFVPGAKVKPRKSFT